MLKIIAFYLIFTKKVLNDFFLQCIGSINWNMVKNHIYCGAGYCCGGTIAGGGGGIAGRGGGTAGATGGWEVIVWGCGQNHGEYLIYVINFTQIL